MNSETRYTQKSEKPRDRSIRGNRTLNADVWRKGALKVGSRKGRNRGPSVQYTFIGCDNPGADGRLGFLAVRPALALSSPQFLVPESAGRNRAKHTHFYLPNHHSFCYYNHLLRSTSCPRPPT